jgi:transcriptional regulator with XRE-family HTH domain
MEMTTEKKNQTLGEYVRVRRESRGIDFSEAERLSGLDHTTWRKLEAGSPESPSPKTLQAIADTLKVPLDELYLLAGYKLSGKLPSFTPYLRARYHLPHQAVQELERYFDMLRSFYGIPDDQSVFPPKPKVQTPKSVPKVSPTKSTRRAA